MLNKLKFLSLYYSFHLSKRFRPPASPRPSSTILLVRDGDNGLEVFMVVRHHKIDFASGALVFPGGKVDAQDRATELRAFCRGVDGIDDYVLSVRVAAIRELFEESGILLASPEGTQSLVSAAQLAEYGDYRVAIRKNKLSMQQFLVEQKLTLACDQLHHFAHWVTPEMLPKRFDTHFYLVYAPADQIGLHDGYESVDSTWIAPQAALEEARAGTRTVVFPTRLNLEKLAVNSTAQGAIEAAQQETIHEVMPTLLRSGMDVYLTIPETAGYGKIMEPLANLM